MRVVSRKTLVEFGEEGGPEVRKALATWLSITKAARWNNPTDVRTTDPTIANNRVVFDILGGRYRLVTAIHYSSGIVFIRFVGTHTAYNGIDATTV
jgi:mRNA interferase HigB